jgi:hypothetical protein
MKKWYSTTLRSRKFGGVLEKLVNLANSKNLSPGELVIVKSWKSITGSSSTDCTEVMYYSDSEYGE